MKQTYIKLTIYFQILKIYMIFFKIWDTLISGYTFSPYSQHKDHVSGANVFVINSDNLNLIVS